MIHFLRIWGISIISLFYSEFPLEITFTGIDSDKGWVMIRITDDKAEVVREDRVKAQKDLEYIIPLPPGKYAISAFHDANSNQKLDKNFLGVPKEKYGFSNNARGVFGPPDLSEQLFDHSSETELQIKLE